VGPDVIHLPIATMAFSTLPQALLAEITRVASTTSS
jgi:hypothetical protein